MIGDVADLKWLWIKRDKIFDAKTEQAAPIDGADIGSLKNIRNLDTLVLHQFDDVLPVLTALKGGKIRRLKITGQALTAEEISALRQLHSLEVINCIGGKRFTEVLDALQSMPNLKRIALSHCDVGPLDKGNKMYHFPKLEVFSLDQECRDAFVAKARTLFRKHFQLPDSFDWDRNMLIGQRNSDEWFQIEQE
jgi:hypothetical protein